MFSELRIGAPHPWNWSINSRLEKTVAEVSLSPIQGGRSSFFAGWSKRCRGRGLGFKLAGNGAPLLFMSRDSCQASHENAATKPVRTQSPPHPQPLDLWPLWIFPVGSPTFSPTHALIKVILGRSASPSFPTKQQAGEEMQTTSCDSFEGFRWKPLAEVRCQFGCHDINP